MPRLTTKSGLLFALIDAMLESDPTAPFFCFDAEVAVQETH
jgi:hypothetical protein